MKFTTKINRLVALGVGGILLASPSTNFIFAQANTSESDSSIETSESVVDENGVASELQIALKRAIELFNNEFPSADISEIDIELMRNNSYEIQLEGYDDTNGYELEFHSSTEEIREREVDDDDSDQAIPIEDLLSIDEISAIAIKEVDFGVITDWHLEHEDDSERFVWVIEIEESGSDREAEIEIDALTGEIIEVEFDD